MTKFEGTRFGKKIASQMLDVTIRVKDVRPFAVRQMVSGREGGRRGGRGEGREGGGEGGGRGEGREGSLIACFSFL